MAAYRSKASAAVIDSSCLIHLLHLDLLPKLVLRYNRIYLNPRPPIDRGEAEAIIQARELGGCQVLTDDFNARRIGEKHSLNVSGVLGILQEFKRNGIIQEIKPLVKKLQRDLKFRIDDKPVMQELSEAGEV